jgi:hypothetical protein
MTLAIESFVYVGGEFAFRKGDVGNVTVEKADGTTPRTVKVEALTLGASNVNIFVGANGPYWSDIDGNSAISWAFDSGNGDAASRTLASGSNDVTIGTTTFPARNASRSFVSTLRGAASGSISAASDRKPRVNISSSRRRVAQSAQASL